MHGGGPLPRDPSPAEPCAAGPALCLSDEGSCGRIRPLPLWRRLERPDSLELLHRQSGPHTGPWRRASPRHCTGVSAAEARTEACTRQRSSACVGSTRSRAEVATGGSPTRGPAPSTPCSPRIDDGGRGASSPRWSSSACSPSTPRRQQYQRRQGEPAAGAGSGTQWLGWRGVASSSERRWSRTERSGRPLLRSIWCVQRLTGR